MPESFFKSLSSTRTGDSCNVMRNARPIDPHTMFECVSSRPCSAIATLMTVLRRSMFCLPLTCLGFGGLSWSTFILPIDVAGQDYSVETKPASTWFPFSVSVMKQVVENGIKCNPHITDDRPNNIRQPSNTPCEISRAHRLVCHGSQEYYVARDIVNSNSRI
ncbi:hypothetical protein IW261DRAFT_144311 [Armillaria novae-zelandiae]|uniref:Uncharacterized protein n=1 Tax=Armillaria novae-zelandiae TaxID=153914 RepID=A0AA39UHW9_9AGAR|nr:hypothetical protein IW261DRAFT_144311 [Armillaria novae-zelandiae]